MINALSKIWNISSLRDTQKFGLIIFWVKKTMVKLEFGART
jgi:hypothetical protein